ncbi:MAG: DUF29 domain-containing protein [Planctomycetota bacterium]
MTATATEELSALYLKDETAWLDAMVDLIGRKEYDEMDYDNLREYLTDMAIRDRREVLSRLVVLIAHHLKWLSQPEKRTPSWRATIEQQSDELLDILESGVLSNYAEEILPKAYLRAVKYAAGETGLPLTKFPRKSELTASEWVALPVPK